MARPLHIADRETRDISRTGLLGVTPTHTQPVCNPEHASRVNPRSHEGLSILERASVASPADIGRALRSIALELDTAAVRLSLDPPHDERAEITVRVAVLRVRLAAASGELIAATRGAR